MARPTSGSNHLGPKISPNNLLLRINGGVKQLQLGNSYWESADYNLRQQPNTMRLGSTSSSGDYWQQAYSYIHAGAAGTTNNGNIKQITQTFGSTTINTNYAYDSLNRLCNAAENGSGAAGLCTAAFVSPSWQQRYDYL